jgi:hypothetical protein
MFSMPEQDLVHYCGHFLLRSLYLHDFDMIALSFAIEVSAILNSASVIRNIEFFIFRM